MRQYVVDAFTTKMFSGNPAAVCVMDHWLSDKQMTDIAEENHLSETAFTVKKGNDYKLRWFTPNGEIDLCGHATLGAAFVILNYYEKNLKEIAFNTKSGRLLVEKKENMYEIDFPAFPLKPVTITSAMAEAMGAAPTEAYMGRDLLCIFDSENIVKTLSPNMEKVKKLDGLLLQVTAKGEKYDCISRSFAPKLGINEDPVCGSGHCHIIPYWAKKTGKKKFVAYQASKRSGVLYCHMATDKRIKIGGNVQLYSVAELFI